MESSSKDSQMERGSPFSRGNPPVKLEISPSSTTDEERPCLAAVAATDWNLSDPLATKIDSPESTTTILSYSAVTTEQAKGEDLKTAEDHRVTDFALDYCSLSSDTEQEDLTCESSAKINSPRCKNNPFNTKPWTVKDVISLLERLKKQVPKVDTKGCLYTAKKLDWGSVAFDCFTAEDCKKEFEVLLNNIKLVKTLTAVISELEEKIPSGKLKTFLVLQPRQQFVRDFAEKNKGLIAGNELFAASAEAWKKLPPEEKQRYTTNYIAAKEKEIACMSGDEPPLRPKIPFELYYEDLCKKKGEKNLELKAVAREKYKMLDPKKKLKYIAMAAIELYTYELQVARYLKKQPDWIVPAQRGPSKEDSELYLRSLGMPSRPPNTASLLYYHIKQKDGQLDHIHGTTRLFYAIEQFRNLSEHKKMKYRQKHREMLQEYTKEYGKWWKKQSEVVRRLADKLLGKKQVLPSGTLCRLRESSGEKDLSMNESRLDGRSFSVHEAERPCCKHMMELELNEHPPEAPRSKKLPFPDMQKLKQISKQDVFFNTEQPLNEKMNKIMLMVSGYKHLPNKARQKFDIAFKKWKYSLEASIIVDVRNLSKYEQQDFLIKYRSVCKLFFKHDIFRAVFPTNNYPGGT